MSMKVASTPEQLEDAKRYQADPDRAAREWIGGKGAAWARRNPRTLADMDASFKRRYGWMKSWVVRDALRSVPRSASWLEVGCSTGVHMALLSALGFPRVYGVDISAEALSTGRNGLTAAADALHLPFATGSVDGVTTAGSLMHLGPVARMRESLREAERVARRYLFLAELHSPQPAIVHFGELLPPIWLFSWERAVPELLGEQWALRYHRVYDLLPNVEGLRAPFCCTLFERAT